ncbi:DUF6516 family protein [Neorhizobium sp. Rsf11]|uniref:DUF6516 family protein n=1 Tax=Neorhizobium phenanthreniclasticum TaxID=3157917 RepID=A0ABV0LV33_9HYPH
MKAERIIRERIVFGDGAILEIRVWRVPKKVPPSEHFLKYSLFYGRPGERLVGYDNERGKGDHRHHGSREEGYQFVSIKQLLADFRRDVEALRGEKI